MEKTLFQKIIAGDLPGEFCYEDEQCVALNDINPQAPTHILVIPRKLIPRLAEAETEDKDLLGHLLLVAKQIAEDMQLATGFRIVINNGRHGGESVPHLHVHLLGGRPLNWPPG